MGREALQPQSPGGRRPRGWKSLIELAFAAMAFRFGALRYGAPKRSIRIGGSQPWSSRRGVDPRPLIPTALSNDRPPARRSAVSSDRAGLGPRVPARPGNSPVESFPRAARRSAMRGGEGGCGLDRRAAIRARPPRRTRLSRPPPEGRPRPDLSTDKSGRPHPFCARSGRRDQRRRSRREPCCRAFGMIGEPSSSVYSVAGRVQAPFRADRSKAWITRSIFRPSLKSTTRDGAPALPSPAPRVRSP